MGVRISENPPVDPYWLPLPRGVEVYVKPLSPALYQTARIAGTRKVGILLEAQDRIIEAGGVIEDLPDLTDENAKLGLSQVFFAENLAIVAIMEWSGVYDMEGEKAKVSEGMIRGLMADPLINDAFLTRYISRLEAWLAEGKDSGISPNGTMAQVPNIAKGVEV